MKVVGGVVRVVIQLEREEIAEIIKSAVKLPLRFDENLNRELVEVERNIIAELFRKFGIKNQL